MIFNKLNKEGFSGHDEVRLRTAMRVPRTMVGRVIGKQGNKVRKSPLSFLIKPSICFVDLLRFVLRIRYESCSEQLAQ